MIVSWAMVAKDRWSFRAPVDQYFLQISHVQEGIELYELRLYQGTNPNPVYAPTRFFATISSARRAASRWINRNVR